jgi:4-amino-4-deoxy-L-arabinose transferase-like glycosyltransferase
MESATHPQSQAWSRPRLSAKLRSLPLPRPELVALLVLAAVLDLWALGRNGFANDYYSAAVHSMAGSWHDFLFGSFDAKGLMTVDKPPAALWVQALSVKAFGFSPWAILVPQALMGAASVGLVYDLTRRRFGRAAGGVAGLCLALTPIAVAISRHNNPDALLVLCCVGALWAFVRALEDGSTRWLLAAGALVGLGFETKMGVALMIVPGMALAWLWVAPRGRMVAVRQLLVAGAVLAVVALAWPVMVELTPASSRPWISGTSDNSVFSLILEYNGLGRLDGQTGGPASFGGGAGGPFGGETGPLRLLNEALGGQAGWLLGMALVGGLGIAVLSRLRRDDPRTGWIVAVGGAFAVVAVAFSFAGGIFHPYYVSLLAPFAAALVGATFAEARRAGRGGRMLGALALGGGAITEIVVLGNSATELGWLLAPIVVAVAVASFVLVADTPAVRWGTLALSLALGVLLIGPAIWSLDTLGHATSGTFPAGGPASAAMGGMGGPGGGPGGMPGGGEGGTSSGGSGAGIPAGGLGGEAGSSSEGFAPGAGGPAGVAPEGMAGASSGLGETAGTAASGEMPGFGEGVSAPPGLEVGAIPGLEGAESGSTPEGAFPGAGALPEGGTGSESGALPEAGGGAGALPEMGAGAAGAMAGGPGGMMGGAGLTEALEYTEAHGGGTLAVESQSEAASAIIEAGAEVAGIGGFSGKESSVSAEWLENEIEAGKIRWILSGGTGGFGAAPTTSGSTQAGGSESAGPGGPTGASGGGDTRTGSESALDKVTAKCEAVESTTLESSAGTLYDCSNLS